MFYGGFRIYIRGFGVIWSGRRDSNPRQPAWKAGTLPTELLPHFHSYFSPKIRLCQKGSPCLTKNAATELRGPHRGLHPLRPGRGQEPEDHKHRYLQRLMPGALPQLRGVAHRRQVHRPQRDQGLHPLPQEQEEVQPAPVRHAAAGQPLRLQHKLLRALGECPAPDYCTTQNVSLMRSEELGQSGSR